MTKIFISHSSNDNDFARQLAAALTGVGIDVWIDLSNIRAGRIWWDEIQLGLDESEIMILILSPDSMTSRNVADEWGYHLEEGKQIFPVRWLPAKVHFRLRGLQYVDFYDKEFERAFNHLCTELKRNGISVSGTGGELHIIQSGEINSDLVQTERKFSHEVKPLDDDPFSWLTELEPEEYTESSQRKNRIPKGVEDILPPPFEWIEIPSGKVNLEAGGYLQTPTMFDVPAFTIAKYPITLNQYYSFANKGDGDADPVWWTFSKDAKNNAGFRSRPDYLECPDCPVTNVRWFDAIAFCRWLSAKTGLQITLPTEQQWQRAAIGDKDWQYPWGNDFHISRANTDLNSNRQLISVTHYLQGISPLGVMDMSGNAWELCLTDWNNGDIDISKSSAARCMRGGAFTHNQSNVKATFREYHVAPGSKFPDVGFRIVLNY